MTSIAVQSNLSTFDQAHVFGRLQSAVLKEFY